jgi:hypothetical protein
MAISNETAEKVIPYAEEYDLPFAVAAGSSTGNNLNAQFGVRGIPHSFLIDPEGTIAWHGHPSGITDSQIKKVLKGVKSPPANQILALTFESEMEGRAGKAVKLARSGELAKALREIQGIDPTDTQQMNWGGEITARIEAHVQLLSVQIERLISQRDVMKAIDAYEAVAAEFKGTELGAPSASRLKEIAADKGLQQELDASKAFKKAMQIAQKRGMKKVVKKLEALIKKYPATKAADKAKVILVKL